ncbi:MAG TPA: radical SAM protein [Candidatus Thermoplasmatota archaeon]|nr:radical SAM protein [Candidatus Thermoplasmatota archaeon]
MSKLVLVDGYVDEPSAFGVPPYISPHARYAAGAALAGGWEVEYHTIDALRARPRELTGDALAILSSCVVPGKYLRGAPITHEEAVTIFRDFRGERLLFGANAAFGFADAGGGHATTRVVPLKDHVDHFITRDGDAAIAALVAGKTVVNRFRTADEWDRHAIAGAEVVDQHPDMRAGILMAEIDTFLGCVHYVSGGCGFCKDAKTKPWYREEEAIRQEVEVLHAKGVRHFRLGGQSCFWTYKAVGVGLTDEPKPNVEATRRLLEGVHSAAPDRKVLHIDNANPAVLATHEEEARAIARMLVEFGTDGNIAAFGLESADPAVHKANNLNATPEQTMLAIRILNEEAGHRGPKGLPYCLPGLNLLYGLPGETAATYDINWRFLMDLKASGLRIRRLNIRQLLPIRGQKETVDPKLRGTFKRHKQMVREEFDQAILKTVAPSGTLLRDVYLEKTEPGITYGRQVATYALLVGIPYETSTERFTDVLVTDHGYRSLTGVPVPFDVPSARLKELEALPGIGRKRAATLKAKDVRSPEEFAAVVQDPVISNALLPHLRFGARAR